MPPALPAVGSTANNPIFDSTVSAFSQPAIYEAVDSSDDQRGLYEVVDEGDGGDDDGRYEVVDRDVPNSNGDDTATYEVPVPVTDGETAESPNYGAASKASAEYDAITFMPGSVTPTSTNVYDTSA